MKVQAGIKGPVDLRAWTLQERLLSPRLLDFTTGEIYWECKKYQSCESGDTFSTLNNEFDTLINGGSDARQPYNAWYFWVEQLSTRNLTRDTDKLPSMGGLARVVEKTTGDRYVAGLWLNDILFGLVCWSSEYNYVLEGIDYISMPKTPLSGYQAPSWSWASTDGRIKMLDRGEHPDLDDKENAVIKKVDIAQLGGDEMGKVKNGKIWIKSRWSIVTIRRKIMYENSMRCGHGRKGRSFFLESAI